MNCTGFPLHLQGPTGTMKDISFAPSLPVPANCAATQKLGTGLAGSAPRYPGFAARNELRVTTDARRPVRRPPHPGSRPPGKPGIVWADVPRGGTTAPLLRVRSSPAAGVSMPRRVPGKPAMRLAPGRLRAGSTASSLPGANSTGPDAALPLRSHVSYGGLGEFGLQDALA